jgi:hypothetical protein
MEKQINNSSDNSPEGIATHSGWMHFYVAFAKYRDESIRLCQNVISSDSNLSVNSLSLYHSSIYSMAQQIFSFYDATVEEELTLEWLTLGEKVNDFLYLISDKDFRSQMRTEGKATIDKDLMLALLKYFNKVDRLAASAGLLVGQEDKGSNEPKKGLIGLGRK